MRLVTFDDGRVGRILGDGVVELDVPDIRQYLELGGDVQPTGREAALADVRLRAPIVPKKFFHPAGNFREDDEESRNVNWSHPVLPWIVFFQNVDAIIGPEDAIVYPEALTNELDYEHGSRRGPGAAAARQVLDARAGQLWTGYKTVCNHAWQWMDHRPSTGTSRTSRRSGPGSSGRRSTRRS